MKIKTIKSRQKYWVEFQGYTYTFMLAENGGVAIYTPDYALGIYRIERFDGELSPNGIRYFLS